jgi:hypothetical protein
MGREAMTLAVEALDAFVARQEEQPGRRVEDENNLTTRFSIRDVAAALEGADLLAERHDASVTLRFSVAGQALSFSRSPGQPGWSPDAGSPVALSALRDREERELWPTALLTEAVGELAGAAEADGDVHLAKDTWKQGLAGADQRWIWIGPTLQGFTRWVTSGPWQPLVRRMLAGGAAAVLVQDAPPLRQIVSPRFVVAKPEAELPALGAEPWLARLGPVEDAAVWRAARLAPKAPLPEDLRNVLHGLATSAAAWALAEDRQPGPPMHLRPRADRIVTWTLQERSSPLDDRRGAALRQLAEWVMDGATQTHLAVARHVAADQIPEADSDIAPRVPLAAAELAFSVTIDRHVAEQLTQQAEFEKTFLGIDKTVTEVRASIGATVDDVVTRVLTASLAIAIAALASPRVRGVPAAVAASLIFLYVLLNVARLHGPVREELAARLSAIDDEVRARRGALSASLAQGLTTAMPLWRDQVGERLRAGIKILVVLAVAVLAAGVFALTQDSQDAPPQVTVTVQR